MGASMTMAMASARNLVVAVIVEFPLAFRAFANEMPQLFRTDAVWLMIFSGVFPACFNCVSKWVLMARNENAGRRARVSFVALGRRLADHVRCLHGCCGRDRGKQRQCKGEVQHLFHFSTLLESSASLMRRMRTQRDLDAWMRKNPGMGVNFCAKEKAWIQGEIHAFLV
jgi:hypothetical protein